MFYRIIRWILHPFIYLFYPTTIINKKDYNADSAVVCCNHFASSDVLVVANSLMKKNLNVLGKAELFKKRFPAWFLRKMGAISVNRDEPDISTHKEIIKRLHAGKQLLIFPEGTRNKSGTREMADFKSGAALYALKTKKPIIPLLFHHKSVKFRRNYLIVGKPIDLSDFYGKNIREVKEEITHYIHSKMQALQSELDAIVLSKKSGKKLCK